MDLVSSFQEVRERAGKFCSDREWEQFHLPTNLVLALAGECGEVCEIFQWKGSLENSSTEEIAGKYSEKEIMNIGEEIADVFIYSTRLADICNIDLAHAVRSVVGLDTQKRSAYGAKDTWDDVTFEDLTTELEEFTNEQLSQRHVALSIQSEMGKLCELFKGRSEDENKVGLSAWNKKDITKLTANLGTICILLSSLAALSSHTLTKCITDKMDKNEAKYPAALVRGSSAKYTEYRDNSRSKKTSGSGSGKATNPEESLKRIDAIVARLPYLVLLVFVVALLLGFVLGQNWELLAETARRLLAKVGNGAGTGVVTQQETDSEF